MTCFVKKMNTKYRLFFLIVCCIILWKAFQYFEFFPKAPSAAKSSDDFETDKEKIKVSVYYEALCSDSKNFINKQLMQTYENLYEHIILDLVPYGKAETFEDGDKITFQCQHAATECLANKIHACVIDLIPDQKIQLKYVSCMINDNMIPHEALERCGHKMGIDYNAILDCSNGKNGSLLLKAYGIKTHAVKPLIHFIPTIEFDGQQKVPLKRVLKNFQKELCDLYIDVPSICL